MRDMKGERIEPRIGAERDKPEAVKPTRRNRASDTARELLDGLRRAQAVFIGSKRLGVRLATGNRGGTVRHSGSG